MSEQEKKRQKLYDLLYAETNIPAKNFQNISSFFMSSPDLNTLITRYSAF